MFDDLIHGDFFRIDALHAEADAVRRVIAAVCRDLGDAVRNIDAVQLTQRDACIQNRLFHGIGRYGAADELGIGQYGYHLIAAYNDLHALGKGGLCSRCYGIAFVQCNAQGLQGIGYGAFLNIDGFFAAVHGDVDLMHAGDLCLCITEQHGIGCRLHQIILIQDHAVLGQHIAQNRAFRHDQDMYAAVHIHGQPHVALDRHHGIGIGKYVCIHIGERRHALGFGSGQNAFRIGTDEAEGVHVVTVMHGDVDGIGHSRHHGTNYNRCHQNPGDQCTGQSSLLGWSQMSHWNSAPFCKTETQLPERCTLL